MMDIVPFNFEGVAVRVVEIEGEPWFVAKDVATVLGYANSRKAVADHCKSARPIGEGVTDRYSPVFDPQTTIIPERDLYRLIMRSRLPAAERFEEWVVGEVLPSIRKTGGFGEPKMDVRDPRHLSKIALDLIDWNKDLQAQIAAAEPKVGFYDRYANADGLYTLQNAGRVLNCGPNRFISRLKQGYLFYQGGNLVPKAQYRDQGLFEVKVSVLDDKARYQTFVTPKGIQYFDKRMHPPRAQPVAAEPPPPETDPFTGGPFGDDSDDWGSLH